MPKLKRKFTAMEVNRIKEPGKHPIGENLYLQITGSGTRSWIFRYHFRGKARWMGLGSTKNITLAQARDQVIDFRRKIASDLDPIEERLRTRSENSKSQKQSPSFDECARDYIKAHKAAWNNPKHISQWENTIATYASPVIGTMSISCITTEDVLRVLQPIWAVKTETASRLRGRMERILSWAKVKKLRQGENPAIWRGNLDQLLPRKNAVQTTTNFKALPFSQIQEFLSNLRTLDGISPRALEFLIFTATRTGETLYAKWDEFDFENHVWSIPSHRMKNRKVHHVPLCKSSLNVLNQMKDSRINDYVFPGTKKGQPLSNMALLMLIKRLKYDITTHGFRSTFSDWAYERTNFSREVIEKSLAHTIKNKAEAAYRRGDLLLKRRKLMMLWDNYCNLSSISVEKPVEIELFLRSENA